MKARIFNLKRAFLVTALVLSIMAIASASYAYVVGQAGQTTLSVFAAYDLKNSDTGIGATIAKPAAGEDFTYISTNSYNLYQTAKLFPAHFMGYNVQMGFAAGYSSEKGESGVVNGVVTGLKVVMTRPFGRSGLSLYLNGSSMSKNFNPTAWFSPDILIGGAGLSYKF